MRSGRSGAVGTSPTSTNRLAKKLIQESLYIYAADKTNGGMALAEQWRLTFEQTDEPKADSELKRPEKTDTQRRKSIITGVNAAHKRCKGTCSICVGKLDEMCQSPACRIDDKDSGQNVQEESKDDVLGKDDVDSKNVR